MTAGLLLHLPLETSTQTFSLFWFQAAVVSVRSMMHGHRLIQLASSVWKGFKAWFWISLG